MTQNRQRRKWLFVLPILAIAVAHVYFFLIPARRQIEELRRNLVTAQAYVARHPDMQKSIAKVESQLAETTAYVNGWRDRGGRPGDISRLFGEINRRAKAAGTTLDSFEPQATTDLQSLRKVPLRIVLHGSFAQFHEMLGSLEQLPDTMWIESLSIDGSQEGDKPLKAEVNLVIFAALPDISD